MKDRVYADRPLTLEHLKNNIRQVKAEIAPNMCQKVVENYLERIDACKYSLRDHLNDVVFHTKCQRSNFIIKKKYHEKKIFCMSLI